jgi:hypothetical protein
MNLREITHAARIELADARPQKPSYRHLLHLATGVAQSFLNRLNNTGRPWNVGETYLQVSSGVSEYPLNVSNVGKILDVIYYDANNQEGTERQIGFEDLTDTVGDFRGDGSSRIAFFRREGQLYAKVRPIPTDSREYTVLYAVGGWAREAALDDSPVLEEHHHLLVARTALDALPAAEWSDDPKKDEAKRAALERSLMRRVEGYERELSFHVASMSNARSHYREEAFPIE